MPHSYDGSAIKGEQLLKTLTEAAKDLKGKADKANITGATKCKITYNGQGIVTSGANLDASDIPNLSASKITSGTFGTDRIADDAITAAKVKDNETLPVNVSGSAGSAQTLPRCRAYFTGTESGYKNLAILEPPDPSSDRLLVLEVLVNQAGGGGATFKGILSVGIRNDGGTYTYGASYVGRNTGPITIYVRYSTNSHRILIYAGKNSSSYCSLTLISRGVTSFDGRLIEGGVVLYDNPALEDMSGYPDVPISYTLCPNTVGRLTVAPFDGVGSTSIPVYVDSNGQVQPCNPSQMTVGNATKWDGHAISVGTVVSGAGTISIA